MELRNQVARYLQSNGIPGGVLADWANGQVLDGRPWQELPLDEFSNDERLQLEQTCRQIVRDTEDRLARGDALLRDGHDPRIHGWNPWRTCCGLCATCPMRMRFTSISPDHDANFDPLEIDRMSGVWRAAARIKAPPLLTAVGAFLAPDAEYLLAIRVLLHLQTGWSPEESALDSAARTSSSAWSPCGFGRQRRVPNGSDGTLWPRRRTSRGVEGRRPSAASRPCHAPRPRVDAGSTAVLGDRMPVCP